MMKTKRRKRIGIFDSGFGGLHVLRSVANALPQYEYIYLGDTARAPYGDRSQETILAFTKQGVNFLFRRGCGIVIVACHTAASEAVRKIQDAYMKKRNPQKKVLGVLIPATEEAVRKTKNRRIGVIATERTVASHKFVRELTGLDPGIRVFQQACPLLVPMIEAGKLNSSKMQLALKKYLAPLLRKNIDTLILGCTHYGILERKIRTIIGPEIRIVSEARVVPGKLKKYLKKHTEIEKTLGKRSSIRFYSTDHTHNFELLGSRIFGKTIRAQKVTLR